MDKSDLFHLFQIQDVLVEYSSRQGTFLLVGAHLSNILYYQCVRDLLIMDLSLSEHFQPFDWFDQNGNK